MYQLIATAIVIFYLAVSTLSGQVDARMLRQPDVSDQWITFVYAGDIWIVPKAGGIAERLSSPQGEESFPRFSPDGSMVAFTGNYDGNQDVYVVPTRGGTPTRLTHHPMEDRMLDWYPDQHTILYSSPMESGRQRFSQFYKTTATGGLPEKLAVPYGEFGAVSPDGRYLAYMPISRDFRTWKRYRGGMAPDIWLFDLKTGSARNLTKNPANDSQPMWHGRLLYFLSDRAANQRHNIWVYNLDDQQVRQVTRFDDFDIHFPAIGPSDIVFEAGGRLYLMDLSNEQYKEVKVQVVADQRTLRSRTLNVAKLIENSGISSTGKRAVFEARGDIFTVPAEHGVIRNLTATSGIAERFPSWSPDGRTVAYWSDRSGEYELAVRDSDGSGSEQILTSLGAGFRYQPFWSPDSKRLAFIDQAQTIRILDRESRQVTEIDQDLWLSHGGLDSFRVNWSPDSRWMVYSRGLDNRSNALFVFDNKDGKRHQLTSGYYNDSDPVFDPEGKYLYFLSNRSFEPSYGDVDSTWIYANTTNIVAASLRSDIPSLLAPRNEEEGQPDSEDKKKEEPEGKEEGKQDKDKDQDKDKPAAPVRLEIENFERRVVVLPPAPGNYAHLEAVPGKVLYMRAPRTGADADQKAELVLFDLKEREEETVLENLESYSLSAKEQKLLIERDDSYYIVDLKPKQKLEDKLATAQMEMTVDPRAEWRQIFNDAWRLERDYFYDPNMHGVDWNGMKERYGSLIQDSVTRWDVNFVLGELIAELNASHTYKGGGDTEASEKKKVGLLGIDWSLENGAYRVKRIIRAAPWDTEVRSPLDMPGVQVSEGDYILAVNGVALDARSDPWAAFEGLADETVALTVNKSPSRDGAREVIVKTLEDETRLRHLAWIESNRRRVAEASNNQVGYIYVPNTGIEGQTELVRQFSAQFTKPGLIIDERFNSGGQIPDRFIELLNRKPLSFWAVRSGKDWQWPPVGHFGPKVMLINGWSGSGGDAFPYYFKEAGIGPVIGSRTWGGLIGISGAPPLIDGGNVTVPTFRMYSPEGEWFAEGHGVEPDIEVPEDPAELAKGRDPQLERAIQETLQLVKTSPAAAPARPGYERRIPDPGMPKVQP